MKLRKKSLDTAGTVPLKEMTEMIALKEMNEMIS
jgi:hypothetical protein